MLKMISKSAVRAALEKEMPCEPLWFDWDKPEYEGGWTKCEDESCPNCRARAAIMKDLEGLK